MRASKILFILLILISVMSCDKNISEEIENIEVDNYIELLKSNQYVSPELPAFTYYDIPALLKYRNETQTITNFPHNGISSLYGSDCKLGMLVLWTIESIRAIAIDSEFLIGRFPSQNPILALRDVDELNLVSDDESHDATAQAYFDWWEGNKYKDFDEFKNVDPLLDTEYRWH